jgi:hypothetical protein
MINNLHELIDHNPPFISSSISRAATERVKGEEAMEGELEVKK